MKRTLHPLARTLALALVVVVLLHAAHAQPAQTPAAPQPSSPKVEPGLWQLSVALKSQNGILEAAIRQAQAQIKLMPPDERKQVEDAMASRGVQMGDQVSRLNVCIGKEDAERGLVPQQSTECTQQVVESGSTFMKVKFKCTSTPPTSGEATVNFQSTKAYTSQGTLDTFMEGQPEHISVDQSGRWLSADCGNLKPLGK